MRSRPSAHDVAAEPPRVAVGDGNDLDLPGPEPVEETGLGNVDADRGKLRAEHRDEDVDVHEVLGDRLEANLPAVALQPARDLMYCEH
jgi:hypothetical protein